MRAKTLIVLAVLTLAACASDEATDRAIIVPEMASMAATEVPTAGTPVVYGDRFPEVLDVAATDLGDGRWRFDVTLSSPYDTPQRYADAWRVLDAEDVELGVRVLLHDHANEQPFTRSETIDIPAGATVVYVEGRDQANGWSGQRFEFNLPTP